MLARFMRNQRTLDDFVQPSPTASPTQLVIPVPHKAKCKRARRPKRPLQRLYASDGEDDDNVDQGGETLEAKRTHTQVGSERAEALGQAISCSHVTDAPCAVQQFIELGC